MIPPIEKTVTVPVTPAEAFRIFTADMALWWPLSSHSLSASDGKTARSVTVEPKKGGKIVETRHDGESADWATVTDWEPGERFAVDWYVGRHPSEATQVVVTFTEVGDGTRVDLTHSGFEVLGPASEEISAGYLTGWDGVFCAAFGTACKKLAA